MKINNSAWSIGGITLILCGFTFCKETATGPHRLGLLPNKIPSTARSRKNPYSEQIGSTGEGQKLFKQHCATCHGEEGRGKGKAVDLHSPLIQKASPGAIFWFLKYGNVKAAMPSWANLTDQQLWEIAAHVDTLD